MGNCASGWGGDREGKDRRMTDRGAGQKGQVSEASGGPSLVHPWMFPSHRQCAPRRRRAEVRTLLGRERGVLLRRRSYRKAEAAGTTHILEPYL